MGPGASRGHLGGSRETWDAPNTSTRSSPQTRVDETVSRELYEDTHSLLREMLREMNLKVDAGLSFKFKPSEESMSKDQASGAGSVDLNYQYEKKTMIKEVSELATIKVQPCRWRPLSFDPLG